MNVSLNCALTGCGPKKNYLLRQQTTQCAYSALRFPYPTSCAVAFRWKTIHNKHAY